MLAAAPKSDVRYFLNGVYVSGGWIEATNGHYLFRAKVDTGRQKRLFTLIGNIPAKAHTTEISFPRKVATHKDAYGKVIGVSYVEEIDGKFPDCKKLIDGFEPVGVDSIGYNPEYMGLPHKLFKASGAALEFGGEDKMAKAVFKTPDSDEVEMYLMPMKI
jgi:hypothetical protein